LLQQLAELNLGRAERRAGIGDDAVKRIRNGLNELTPILMDQRCRYLISTTKERALQAMRPRTYIGHADDRVFVNLILKTQVPLILIWSLASTGPNVTRRSEQGCRPERVIERCRKPMRKGIIERHIRVNTIYCRHKVSRGSEWAIAWRRRPRGFWGKQIQLGVTPAENQPVCYLVGPANTRSPVAPIGRNDARSVCSRRVRKYNSALKWMSR